jgi:hypothetical protein
VLAGKKRGIINVRLARLILIRNVHNGYIDLAVYDARTALSEVAHIVDYDLDGILTRVFAHVKVERASFTAA